jgi:hypothetical protein
LRERPHHRERAFERAVVDALRETLPRLGDTKLDRVVERLALLRKPHEPRASVGGVVEELDETLGGKLVRHLLDVLPRNGAGARELRHGLRALEAERAQEAPSALPARAHRTDLAPRCAQPKEHARQRDHEIDHRPRAGGDGALRHDFAPLPWLPVALRSHSDNRLVKLDRIGYIDN